MTDKLKVLLVEDDRDDRKFFADALESLDMNIALHQVENGEECLTFLEDNYKELNLIFLDLNMPIIDGFECLDKIKANPQYTDLIVAIYSTSSSEQDIDKTFRKGANIYINKPSNFPELKKTLKRVIETNWAYKSNDFNKKHFLLKL